MRILDEAFDIINKMVPNTETVDVNHSIKHINLIESKLSISLPKVLKKFYVRYNENQSILTAFYILNDLDKLTIEDKFLILGYSNEYTEMYGICINDLENECINVKVAGCSDKSNWLDYEELSSFIINCITFQAINLLGASAVLDAKEITLGEYFKPLCIVKNKDSKCISYISNTDNILAVYFMAENIIYFYTNRNKEISMEYRLLKLNQVTRGWVNYYGIANARGKLVELDKWIRRRLRACIWKQWKKVGAKQRNLVKLGIDKYKAWEYANTRKGYWRISNSPILSKSLNNKYLESLGFISLTQTYQMMH